ncbi:MAG: bifunctional 4-hydroxy-2-oxoglutarate aldolase/2-dehydro-3-deoxy-phosphogluconate aldolase [Pseudomonadota bacterium]|nr:bifunctional 4-hydroxy-2-oxoglutarate aldolase/2-dehydro-3-deoxy-phosphogluconate aldolase [Pseudomonadota bacterium]
MKGIKHIVKGAPILPILQADSVEQALNIAKAVEASGLKNLEVVRRTDAAAASVTAIREAFPDMVVGMGTVLSPEHAKEAVEAGSQFLVTPTVSPRLLDGLMSSGVPFIPGTSNPADILMASEYGLTELKFFPAHLSGGAPMLKALGGIFQNISFCPTGGISGSNLNDYLSLKNVFAVGGSWMIPSDMVKAEHWQGITDTCKQALEAFEGLRP